MSASSHVSHGDTRQDVVRELEQVLTILYPQGAVWEVRALKVPSNGTVSGYYHNVARCARDVAVQLDRSAPGVYVTLNPVKDVLLARASNRLKAHAETTTSDAEVIRRRWLPLDFDPQRPAGISSTDAEHAAALARADEIAAYLAGMGWPAPIVADSGNGAHLLYRIDLPNDADARQLVERVLRGVAAWCDDADGTEPCIRLDTSVGNAARIWKLWGTMARKGDALPERPHRRSQLLSVPDAIEVVSREQLEGVADALCPPAPPRGGTGPEQRNGRQWVEDAGAYLAAHGIAFLEKPKGTNARKFVLDACVWNPAHTDHSAWLMQFCDNGAIAAGCSHNSCQGKHWPELRDAVEPGWRDTKNERNERNEENAKGNTSFNSFNSYASTQSPDTPPDPFPKLDSAAFYGVAGDIVAGIEPHTEASPVALLVQLLVAAGNAAGRHCYYLHEADRHHANLYAVLVGDTAKARKGTSWGHVAHVMEEVDPTWASKHVIGGLSSGEGIIHALRNVLEAEMPAGDAGELLRDKRLLAREGEFASVLAQKARDGNILSGVLRDGWDGVPLGSLIKHSPERATNTHLSIIGHITQAELLKQMTTTDLKNGYANRFLYVATRRQRLLPHGGDLEAIQAATKEPARALREALYWARGQNCRRIAHDREAYMLWDEIYPQLTAGSPGIFGDVTSRAEAQVTRLAVVYALLDQSPAITAAHLRAALALWQFCEDSARYIFGDRLGDPVADRILVALRATPEGLTRTEISERFDRNESKARIDTALAALEEAKLAHKVKEPTGEKGRPPERWKATK